MTDAERALWRMLRENFADWHFRRQVPIRHFIADFASHRAKLIVEADGGQQPTEADVQRSSILAEEGYRVIRFWNNEVLGNRDGVFVAIESALRERHPAPTPPHQGEGL
jgi:very-short-patch-repair endonuclease